MPSLTLYHYPRACSRVTVTAMIKMGIEYKSIIIDITKDQQNSPEYLAVNPDGKVPALLVDGEIITQNAAILTYLHRLQPSAGLLPSTETLAQETQQLSDLIWIASTVHPMVRQIRSPKRFTSGDKKSVKADGELKISKLLPRLEDRFKRNNWWYGEDWSIIDIYLHWCLNTAASTGLNFDDYPAVSTHLRKIEAIPEHAEAYIGCPTELGVDDDQRVVEIDLIGIDEKLK
ncbi:MAG: glutathione S-transferase family protein, partial [Pseudomonadota bacterium]